jgi:hypothetical protein
MLRSPTGRAENFHKIAVPAYWTRGVTCALHLETFKKESAMSSRHIAFVAVSCLFAAVSGCQSHDSDKVAMTEGDRVRMRGQMMEEKGKVMSRGERLVAEGEGIRAEGRTLKDQGRTVEGERKIAAGDAKIREGEALIAQAEAMPSEPARLEQRSAAAARGTASDDDANARAASDREPATRPSR